MVMKKKIQTRKIQQVSEEGRRRSAPNLMDENDNDENDNDNDTTTNNYTAPNTVTHNQSNSIPSSSSKTTKTSKVPKHRRDQEPSM